MSVKWHRIFPRTFLQFLKISLKITRDFYRNMKKIYSKGYFPFLWNYFLIFLKIFKYFSDFSNYYPGFSNFLIFAKIFPKFSKNYFNASLCSKILHKNLKNSTFSKFFKNFFTNDKLKIHYNEILKWEPLKTFIHNYLWKNVEV